MKPYADNLTPEIVPDEYADASWLEQEGLGFEDRLAAYQRDEFGFVGIRVSCTLHIPHGSVWILQEITSPGLWGIEDDSGEDYIAEVVLDETAVIRSMLEELGAELRA